MGQGVVAPKLPAILGNIETARDAIAAYSGFSAALMYLGIFLSTYRYGRLADAGRVHWLIAPGLLVYALTLIALGLASTPTQVFAAQFVEGLALSAVYVAADFVLGRLSAPAVRGAWLSYYGVALSIGLLLGPALGLGCGKLGAVAGIPAAVASAPLFPMAIVATLALVMALLTRSLRVPKAEDASAPAPRMNLAALSAGAAYGYMEAGLVAVFPVLCVQEFHVLPEICLIVVIVTAALASVAWGALSDRFGPARIMRILLAMLCVGPLLLAFPTPLTRAVPLWLASGALFGVLAGGMYPVGFAWLLEPLGESQYGFASGSFARAYGLGSLAGPLAAGLAAQRFGAVGLLSVMTLAGMGGFAAVLWIRPLSSAATKA